jgi:hypothetical protein
MVGFDRTDLNFTLTRFLTAKNQPPVNPQLPYGLREVRGGTDGSRALDTLITVRDGGTSTLIGVTGPGSDIITPRDLLI